MRNRGNGPNSENDEEEWEDFDPTELPPEEFWEEVRQPAARPSLSFLARHPSGKSFRFAVVFALIATVASVVSWNFPDFEDAWIGNPERIFAHGEWWRLVTSMLLHSDMGHLLSNLLFLIPFGGLLTNYFSWKSFPLLGLVLGTATQYLSLMTYDPDARLLGASGLLYVLFGLWLALYFRAETRLKWSNKLMRIVGFGLVMFIPAEFQPRVSYRTHYIGLALGLAGGWIYGRLSVKKDQTTSEAVRRH